MELLAKMLSSAFEIFCLPLNLFGYSFSFWQVFAFSAVAGIVGRFLAEVFLGD